MPIIPRAKPKEKLDSSTDEFLSREDVILRRLHHVKELRSIYRNQYWGLMEEVRAKYTAFVWETGKSPFESNEESKKEENKGEDRVKCKCNGCGKKAMPSTVYCFSHILEDKEQTLYKRCRFITRRSPLARCSKPVLRSKVPCYCTVHYMSTKKQISQGFKNSGLISSEKVAPMFFLIISSYVKKIQAKRRGAKLGTTKTIDKMEIDSANTVPPAPHHKTDYYQKNMLPPIVPTGNVISVGKNQIPLLVPRKKVSFTQRPLLQTSKGVMMHPTPNRLQNGRLSGTV